MKKTLLGQAISATAILCLTGFSHSAAASNGDGWQWTVAPYVWLSGITTDVKTNVPPSEASSDRDFGNVIDNISGFFEIHAEGQGADFGMFTDFMYVGLTGEKDRSVFTTKTSLDGTVFELAGTWNPSGAGSNGFQVFGGLRYVDLGLEFKLKPNNPDFPTVKISPDKSNSDFLFGGRYTFDMAQRWAMTLRADGSWGQTDGTYNLSALAQYKMESGAWLFGYRYMNISLKNDNVKTEISLNGPTVGYAFQF